MNERGSGCITRAHSVGRRCWRAPAGGSPRRHSPRPRRAGRAGARRWARQQARPGPSAVGDSYISGEAGRWAGSTNESSSWVDALGSTAYDDNAARQRRTDRALPPLEVGRGLHRRRRQRREPRLLGRQDLQLQRRRKFKPGLDFYNSGGNEGQALMLQNFAKTHNVKLVAVSIGGNNFNFAGIVQTCVEDFLFTPDMVADLLQQRKLGHEQLHGEQRVQSQRRNQEPALRNVAQAMTNAGYSSLAVHDAGAGLPVADPARLGLPLLPERLLAADDRRLRLLEHGRELRERKNAADDRQHGPRRRERARPRQRQDDGDRPPRSTGGGCARRASGCSRKRG